MSSRLNDDDAELSIETRKEGAAMVVSPRGDVTAFSSPALRGVLRQAAQDRPARLVVDLSATRYIDSSGVATLVEALQNVRRYKGMLVLAGASPRVRGILEIARLDGLFNMAADVGQALAN